MHNLPLFLGLILTIGADSPILPNLFILSAKPSVTEQMPNPNPKILRAKVWVLVHNPRISLKFSENQMVSGSGGCNRFTGRYQLTGNQLKLGPIAATKMACMAEVMEQEAKFFQALDTAEQACWDSKSLSITTKTGILQFRPQT